MNKAVNDFKNLFSIIFFLIGGYFLFLGVIHIAIISLISLLFILFVNSDWFYTNFDVKHYNLFVVFIIFVLIGVNSFFIYNEMKFSVLFNKVSNTEQTEYLKYENSLFEAIKPCVDGHNKLYTDLKSKTPSQEDIKDANLTCYRTIEKIEMQEISENFPKEIKNLCMDLKNNFVQIAINLSSFEYSTNVSQDSLKTRVLNYHKNILTDMNKIRNSIEIKDAVNESQKDFVKF